MVHDRHSVGKAIIITLIVFSFFGRIAHSLCSPQGDALIQALCMVESGGNPDAVGDGGKAVGILQIHPIMVRDVNRILGREVFTDEDRWDAGKSRTIARTYLDYYGGTTEERARKWNGGPQGHTKKSTLGYWHKVERILTGERS